MSTTRQQDMDFAKALGAAELLDAAIEWIQSNMRPEDVFDEDALTGWATESGFVKQDVGEEGVER